MIRRKYILQFIILTVSVLLFLLSISPVYLFADYNIQKESTVHLVLIQSNKPPTEFTLSVSNFVATAVINGIGGGMFKPDALMTRAEFVTMAVRAFNPKETVAQTMNFRDVSNHSAWYYDSLQKAHKAGWIVGVGGRFLPNAPISREQMMLDLNRMIVNGGMCLPQEGSDLSTFQDFAAMSQSLAYNAEKLVKAKVVIGKNGKLAPKLPASRAEGAVMIHRLWQYTAV